MESWIDGLLDLWINELMDWFTKGRSLQEASAYNGLAELSHDQQEQHGRGGEAAKHDFGVLLDAMDLGQEAEGLVNRHVADEGDEEDRAEGGAGLGGIQIGRAHV